MKTQREKLRCLYNNIQIKRTLIIEHLWANQNNKEFKSKGWQNYCHPLLVFLTNSTLIEVVRYFLFSVNFEIGK